MVLSPIVTETDPLRVEFVVFSVTVTIRIELPEAEFGLSVIHESVVDADEITKYKIGIQTFLLAAIEKIETLYTEQESE
jgi:hypothetical protein